MAHRKPALPLLLLLLPLFAIVCFGGARAQFQLSPPPVQADSWTAQIAQTNAAPAPPRAEPPAEAAKAAPPDVSIVDRATGMDAAPAMEAWAKTLDELDQTLDYAGMRFHRRRSCFSGSSPPHVTLPRTVVSRVGIGRATSPTLRSRAFMG